MRLRLEQLDVRGLDLQLGRDDRRVVLGSASELAGQLVQEGGRVTLEDASLARGEVATMTLRFGSTTVATDVGILLEDVMGRAQRDASRLMLELRAARATSAQLEVRVGDVTIRGRIDLAGVRLRVDGLVFAEQVTLLDVSLALGTVQLSLDRVVGAHVAVGWGAGGVRVDAAAIDLSRALVHATFAPRVEAEGERPARPVALTAEELLPLLDGLSGFVNVDLGLDLTVPVIGRRNATHQFRIPIEDGAIDYRKLESDLSTLEDALLDFSMRDGELVLEMGIPFVPTRGRGKPILRWELGDRDRALAENRRIRLAMLPRFRTSGDGESDPAKPSRVSLRELDAANLDVRLQLQHDAPPARIPLRRIDELAVTGTLSHAPEAPAREGGVQGHVAGVELGPLTVPLGKRQLGFDELQLERADDITVAFAGIAPRALGLVLRGLTVTGFVFRPRAAGASREATEPRANA